jgi:hypothetical protein
MLACLVCFMARDDHDILGQQTHASDNPLSSLREGHAKDLINAYTAASKPPL